MRQSKTVAKLKAGELVRVCALGHFIPPFIRHAADQGFDCIWLDTEHRALARREVQALLAHFHLFDIDCMLRPTTIEKNELYRYLEDGSTGLMIPHVSTPEKAADLVQSVKFPPMGDRGLDGAGFDADYILQGGPDYTDQANAETFLTVQIETHEAIANIDAIAATKGVDVLFVGPGDLGLRIAKYPELGLTLDDAFDRVAEAAKKHGKAWGCPVADLGKMQEMYDRGARFLSHGGDFGAILNMLKDANNTFDDLKR